MSSLPPNEDQAMRDHVTAGAMEVTESMLAMQDAVNQMHEDLALARDSMTPVLVPGTARRLGLRRPCACMATPVRIVLGAEPSAEDVAELLSQLDTDRIITIPGGPTLIQRGRCDGTCPANRGR